jgi:hypothetical protein
MMHARGDDDCVKSITVVYVGDGSMIEAWTTGTALQGKPVTEKRSEDT